MLSARTRIPHARTLLSLLTVAAITFVSSSAFAASGTLTVSGTQWGVTSQYLGANECSSQFNINDLVDLGVNAYRIYGGMSRGNRPTPNQRTGHPASRKSKLWEFSSANFDAVVGTPTLSNGKGTFTIPANGTELLKSVTGWLHSSEELLCRSVILLSRREDNGMSHAHCGE